MTQSSALPAIARLVGNTFDVIVFSGATVALLTWASLGTNAFIKVIQAAF